MKFLSYLAALAFPELCPGCGRALLEQEKSLCMHCLCRIPRNNFCSTRDNPAETMLWGRFPVKRGTAYCRFSKDSLTQKLLHDIKYRGNRKLATEMGKLMGRELQTTFITDADCLVPVPLHRTKLRLRGYNQSELLANGISHATGLPVVNDVLLRKVANPTQTHQDKIGRWHNTVGIFDVNPDTKNSLTGKHVLLIDDVITTGSTIEACCHALSQIENISISFACLAMA